MADKHTPGPWNVEDRPNWKHGGYVRSSEGVIAGVGGMDSPAEVNIANARLIAAAPEMLKALRAVLKAWNEGIDDDAMEAPFALVADAIKEATGEEA